MVPPPLARVVPSALSPSPLPSSLPFSSGGASASTRLAPPLLIGSWNVSWWVQDRLLPILDLGVQVLALQETKLSLLPLESARGSLRRRGWSLDHGHPVPATGAGIHGDHCGVAFLTAPGVALSPLHPRGAAWHRLHALARLHAAEIPPREGLPRGLRLFSIYAPLARDADLRHMFLAEFWALITTLDLSVPTLLMGDFNGSVDPDRDYSAGSQPCSLTAS